MSAPAPDPPDPTAPVSPLFVRTLYAYEAADPNALSFPQGAVIEVLSQLDTGWWDGLLLGDTTEPAIRGWFPSNFVKALPRDELERLYAADPDTQPAAKRASSPAEPSPAIISATASPPTPDINSFGADYEEVADDTTGASSGADRQATADESDSSSTVTDAPMIGVKLPRNRSPHRPDSQHLQPDRAGPSRTLRSGISFKSIRQVTARATMRHPRPEARRGSAPQVSCAQCMRW